MMLRRTLTVFAVVLHLMAAAQTERIGLDVVKSRIHVIIDNDFGDYL